MVHKLLCKILGHKLTTSDGDCFIAGSSGYCAVRATWETCKRKDYNQMRPHTHQIVSI